MRGTFSCFVFVRDLCVCVCVCCAKMWGGERQGGLGMGGTSEWCGWVYMGEGGKVKGISFVFVRDVCVVCLRYSGVRGTCFVCQRCVCVVCKDVGGKKGKGGLGMGKCVGGVGGHICGGVGGEQECGCW